MTQDPLAGPAAVQTAPLAKPDPSPASTPKPSGSQQRVAIARALAMGPALLLADEPTGNLDTHSADEVFAPLRRFNAEHGTTVLFVTHNLVMSACCGRTIEVVDGQVARP